MDHMPASSEHSVGQKSNPPRKNISKTSLVLIVFLLLCNVVFFGYLLIQKYSYLFETKPKQAATQSIQNTPIPRPSIIDKPISYYNQSVKQELSQQLHSLLTTPDVVRKQLDNPWVPMECLNEFSALIRKDKLLDEVLRDGLYAIENHQYTTITRYEDGHETIDLSEQEIQYTAFCKDQRNYYVLFLTTGNKENQTGVLDMGFAHAAGGSLGVSNFAVIPFSGKVSILENIIYNSERISVNDLATNGFGSATGRGFAYYGCYEFYEKLGDELYIFCGGEGATSLLEVTINPIRFREVSFCWSRRDSNRICYDVKGNQYVEYEYTIR